MQSTIKDSTSKFSGGTSGAPLPFAILGGGISGLALATFLHGQGMDAHLFEKSEKSGGVIKTASKDGFLFERGPHTILDKSDSLNTLIELAGLQNEVQRVSLKSQERYVWHGGRLNPVPTSAAGLMGSKLFSLGGKMRLMREPTIPPVRADETLKDFAVRRVGQEAYERAVVPFVQGVGAGDPARMSAAASFPILKEMERSAGSLLKGFMQQAKDRKEKNGKKPKSGASMVMFRGGMERFPEALARGMGENYQPGVEIVSVEPMKPNAGFNIRARSHGGEISFAAERVALCGEAVPVADWIQSFEAPLAQRLRAVHYAPLVSVGLGVEKGGFQMPPGFGFLAARDQGLRILGVIFVSNFLPDRAPDGCSALAVMLGGDLDPGVLQLDDAALIEIIRSDLRKSLGWDGRIRSTHIERWERAIPQYGMDHFRLVEDIAEAEKRHAGLHFFGNWRGGVSINDRIDQAFSQASQIAKKSSGIHTMGGNSS